MSEDDTEPELGEGDAGLDDVEAEGVEEGWVAGDEVGPEVGVSDVFFTSATGLSFGYPEEVVSTGAGEEEGACETVE